MLDKQAIVPTKDTKQHEYEHIYDQKVKDLLAGDRILWMLSPSMHGVEFTGDRLCQLVQEF